MKPFRNPSLYNLAAVALVSLSGCLDKNENYLDEYADWKALNEQYVNDAEAKLNDDGTPYYTRVVPSWAPAAYSLVHWYNDRSLTENNLSPMDNSTVQMTYELFDIYGQRLSDSFASADSTYTSLPSNNIVGVWSTVTQMHVGDSVQIVIPSQAGYGAISYGDIKPYTTLVYNIKLKRVKAYEVP